MRKILVVFLILLVVIVVGADIALRGFAERTVAERVAQQMQTSEEPDVTIGGWAFLPQAIGGTYSEITITAGSATVSGVTLEQIEATATDVDAPLADLLNDPTVVAGQVEGSFVVPYAYFNPHLPEGVTITTENGEPRITGELAIPELGVSTSISAAGEFQVDGGTVTVTPVDIEVSGAPVDVTDTVAGMLTFSVEAPELPFGLTVTEMENVSSGVRITGAGQDVPLMGSGVA
jgi:Tfp pilus assembly major pilin PilA